MSGSLQAEATFPPKCEIGAYSVLATVSSRYSQLMGRSSTRYSPVRRFTQAEAFSRNTCMC